MDIDVNAFRAYDIRGKVGPSLTAPFAELLGKAFGTYVAKNGETQIVVGRDDRASGPELKEALMRGLASTGATVLDVGLSTSPALYYAVASWGLPGGVNVTGSHNPPDENGFKLVGDGNRPIAGDEIQVVRKMMEAGEFAVGEGRIEEREIKPAYYEHLEKASDVTRKFRVVVDTGNGVAGLFAPQLLRDLGCDVIELYTELDNTFPNHPPDPQMPENVVDLQKKVVEEKADIGLAFDGDGDRLGVIDEKGNRHEADYVLMLLARAVLDEQPGAKIIIDIKSSQPVIDDIRERGGDAIIWKTGHSFIKLKMREEQAPLAGEASGHLFYKENYYSDDGLYAACKLLSYLSKDKRPLSAHFEGVPVWYTSPELRVPCDDAKKWDVVDAVAKELRSRHDASEIDGIRANWPDGWALVRASNTGPNLTVRFEARTQEALDAIDAELKEVLGKYVQTW